MSDKFVSRGFVGKRRDSKAEAEHRLPPGQYVVSDFPSGIRLAQVPSDALAGLLLSLASDSTMVHEAPVASS